MKLAAIAFFTALSLIGVRADTLANDDFHDGKAHWKGDVRSADDQDHYSMSSIDTTSAGGSVVVELKNAYAKIYQDFNSHDNLFTYKIQFQLSADYAPHGGMGGGNMPPGMNPPPGVPRSPSFPGQKSGFLSSIIGGNYTSTVTPPHGANFLLFVVDLTNDTVSSVEITPALNSEIQTVTGTLPHLAAHDEKTLYLVFSPGKGSVTLHNISLTPAADSTNGGSQNPFQP